MLPASLVTSSSGSRQGCRSSKHKPRLVLKTINVVIEDEVNEMNEEVTLWNNEAVDQAAEQPPSRGALKSSQLFNGCIEGEDDDEEVTNRASQILATSSTAGAQFSAVGGNPQHLLLGDNTASFISDRPNYQLMPMPAGYTAISSSVNSLQKQRPQAAASAAAKRIFWGEEVPLMAVPVQQLPSSSSSSNSKTATKSMMCSKEAATDVSYSMTAGHLPLITIKPLKSGGGGGNTGTISDDISATSAAHHYHLQRQPRRLLELSSLLNFFQLLVPTDDAGNDGSSSSYMDTKQKLPMSKSPYFLTLLDPSMPRLTNCGYYYRMRYAVYVMVKSTPASSATLPPPSVLHKFDEHSCWRNSSSTKTPLLQSDLEAPLHLQSSDQQPLVLHIGELHLYTIFPKEGKGGKSSNSKDLTTDSQFLPKWCQPGHLHYENVSFFANTAALTGDELAALLPATAGDINALVFNFRRTLKLLNSVVITLNGNVRLEQQPQQSQQLAEQADEQSQQVPLSQHSLESTLLLEQLKYPKSSADFANTDRTVLQFLRNQLEMFSRYQEHYSTAGSGLGDSNQTAEATKKFQAAVVAFEKKLPPVMALTATNKLEFGKSDHLVDWSTVDDFLVKLHRFRNQATKSSSTVADKR